MKICRVTQALYPYVVGGLPTHCHELSNCQSEDGHTVTVLTVKRGHKVENTTCGYDLKRFRWFKMPWDFFGMENPICPGLWIELLKCDFDVLHLHSHLFFTTLFSAIISKIKHKPCVVTIHGVKAVRDEATNFFQIVWIKSFSRLIFKIVGKIICQTQSDVEEIKEYVTNKEKIVLLSNGINLELFSPSDSYGNYVLWVGRFVKEKGLTYLVDVFKELSRDFSDKKVVLVGEGPVKKQIQNKVKENGLGEFFVFKKNCSQNEIAKLMRECELYVLPSLQEGFPKSLLEAMACAKPVITTKSLKDIINGAGIAVEPANVEELEKAIRTLLSDPAEGRKIGQVGRRLVEKNWSWDIVSKKTENVYNSMIVEDGVKTL